MAEQSQKLGRLFVVGTPLGNLEDVSLRALRTLKEVRLIAAEDTRVCRKLLSRYSIATPTTSFHEHSPPEKLRSLVAQLLAGKDLALVSDAGMPGISDPGEKLVAECIAQGIEVVAVPGPSAVTTALAVSGLPTAQFVFIGFLPRKGKARREALEALRQAQSRPFLCGKSHPERLVLSEAEGSRGAELASQPRTLVLYEAPHRLVRTLADLQTALGNRRAAAARELTKKFEEVVRGTLEEIAAHFTANPPRGEITLVVEGLHPHPALPHSASADLPMARQGGGDLVARRGSETPPYTIPAGEELSAAVAAARALMKRGFSAKDAAKEIAEVLGVSRRLLYNALQKQSVTTDEHG